MERVPIELETFHHIYNRGTEKRQIFMDDEDYKRFVLYINVLNNKKTENPSKLAEQGRLESYQVERRLVEVCAFTLMPNHYHLLLYELTEGGIAKFMQRLGTAYTVYFNEKYTRSGALFQGVYKSKYVVDESYLLHVINYIHFNPKDLVDFKIRNSLSSFLDYLDSYPWTSYGVYANNESSKLIQRNSLLDLVELEKEYRSELLSLYDDTDLVTECIKKLTFDE